MSLENIKCSTCSNITHTVKSCKECQKLRAKINDRITLFFFITGLAAIVWVGLNTSNEKNISVGYTNGQQTDLIIESKSAVSMRLKDPNSASFRNVYFYDSANYFPTVCGEVNSKNSFGGYSGFKKFISGGDINSTILEEDTQNTEEFVKLWLIACEG